MPISRPSNSKYLGETTFASLPTASTVLTGSSFYVTNIGGGAIFISNGTRWKPQNGRCNLYTLDTRFSFTGSATETVLGQILLPAGLLQNGDRLLIRATTSKSGTAETVTSQARFGTAGTIADTSIVPGNSSLSTTVRTNCFDLQFQRVSATSIQKHGSSATLSLVSTSTTAYASPVTVSNMDSNAMYLSLTGALNVGVESEALESMEVYLVSTTN